MESDSAPKKNKAMSFACKWIQLERILSELNHSTQNMLRLYRHKILHILITQVKVKQRDKGN
jgi:predicted alpha/beta-fold hydrolase